MGESKTLTTQKEETGHQWNGEREKERERGNTRLTQTGETTILLLGCVYKPREQRGRVGVRMDCAPRQRKQVRTLHPQQEHKMMDREKERRNTYNTERRDSPQMGQ